MVCSTLGSSVPMTTRSGFRKSSTAVPSFRNSGLETTANGCLVMPAIVFLTRAAVPTGTVDLVMTTLKPSMAFGDAFGHLQHVA